VLSELAPEQRLDKNTYRMGAAPDEVLSKFRAISALTSRFEEVVKLETARLDGGTKTSR
jgi:hypothetical protein